MTGDLVERLRARVDRLDRILFGGASADLLREAADEIERLRASPSVDELIEALTKCRARFYEYADSHSNKGTFEGDIKAARNIEMAGMCSAALRAREVSDRLKGEG